MKIKIDIHNQSRSELSLCNYSKKEVKKIIQDLIDFNIRIEDNKLIITRKESL